MNYTIFGESHGAAIGVTMTDVPSGLCLDMEKVAFEMARRAPGKDAMSTARQEADKVEILSGIFEGKTSGAPLCAVIYNTDTRSRDYQPELPRPSHGDYAGHVRFSGCNDYRGGGHFSGRLTAPLVFAGAVAKQILAQKNIYIGAHIESIRDIKDAPLPYEKLSKSYFENLAAKQFPTVSDKLGERMQQAILEAKSNGDSVGGGQSHINS